MVFRNTSGIYYSKSGTTIQKAAPSAGETISYGIPTFTLNGNLVHFAAFKNHIGFYPAPTAIKEFEKEFSIYKTSKGAVQFPLDKPMPLNLISKIVKYRVKINSAKPVKENNSSESFQFYSTIVQLTLIHNRKFFRFCFLF